MIKKILPILLIVSLLLAFTACSDKAEQTEPTESTQQVPASSGDEVTELKVGFCPGPYSDLWKKAIAPQLEKKGYSISYVEFSDYVQPNLALANKEINVNMFQHSIYLNNFSKQHNLSLSLVTEIPTVGMGIWSNTTKSIAETKKGAVVTIPNDETNMARGLRVLEAAGLIKLKDGIDKSKATVDDIGENSLELKIVPTEAAQIPRTLDSADLAVVNGNFAVSAGLNPTDSLYNEVLGEGYVNVIAVRTEDLDKQFVKDIKEAATNDEFKAIVDDPQNGFSGFQKPAGW
jgi:D-methionine transport system substrate-binding protein